MSPRGTHEEQAHDSNDHLFVQLERLAQEDLTAEQISDEVKCADAIVSVSDSIVGNAELQLKAAKLFADHGAQVLPMLPQIGKASE